MGSIRNNYMSAKSPNFFFKVGEQGWLQWWEHSPPTNVAQVQILALMSYVSLAFCWFLPLLWEVFLHVLWFPPLLKNQHNYPGEFQFYQESSWQRTTMWKCYLNLQSLIKFSDVSSWKMDVLEATHFT